MAAVRAESLCAGRPGLWCINAPSSKKLSGAGLLLLKYTLAPGGGCLPHTHGGFRLKFTHAPALGSGWSGYTMMARGCAARHYVVGILPAAVNYSSTCKHTHVHAHIRG